MVMGLLVLVAGYWIARALQPDAAARAVFEETSPVKRTLLGFFTGSGLVLSLMAQAVRVGIGAAGAWLAATVIWVLVVRALLARLVPNSSHAEGAPGLGREPHSPERAAVGPAAAASAGSPPRRRSGPLKPLQPPRPWQRQAPRSRPEPPALYPDTPDRRFYRLHCKVCDSVLTRPIREYHPTTASKAGNFRYGARIRPGSQARPTAVDVLPGDARDAYFLSAGVLDQAATPLTWDTSSEGCCGPEACRGPNVLCHGCGSWALFYNETCYSPTFFAGRPTEVELRECDPAERSSREHALEVADSVSLEATVLGRGVSMRTALSWRPLRFQPRH